MRFPLCIIPAAGKGTRLGAEKAKCLVDVSGKPIIEHVVDFWGKLCDEVVVVCRPEHDEAFRAIVDRHVGGVVVVDPDPESVNGSILAGLEATRAPEMFAVGLGDCLFDGEFDFTGIERGYCHGVGVMEGDSDFRRSYAVGQENPFGRPIVQAVIEKPLMGLGAYFLRWTALRALEHQPGITDAIDLLTVDEVVVSIPFHGSYLNVTYPEDLTRWEH